MQFTPEYFMKLALEQAQKAALLDEVPIGAVIVQEKDLETGLTLSEPQIMAQTHNNRETNLNPTGHAELLAINEAAQKLGRWRLKGCTLYVTLEPCLMCAGAIILSRLDRVVYGALDPKAGAVTSLYKTLSDVRLNHRPELVQGVCEKECSFILKEFFAKKRTQELKGTRYLFR
jgi:tRNA(adenine34) deaminase